MDRIGDQLASLLAEVGGGIRRRCMLGVGESCDAELCGGWATSGGHRWAASAGILR